MDIDVDATIWLVTKIEGPEPNNINMEVDVDIATWSITKTKGPKPSSIN